MLKIVSDLVQHLEEAGIQYCHWKSNEHLDTAVFGDTDLDILGLFDFPAHRTIKGKGIIVALVGADGSGKSTQVKALRRRLEAKVDVVTLYMGLGAGLGSIIRTPLDLLKKAMIPLLGHSASDSTESRPNKVQGVEERLRNFGNILWSIVLAWEKQAKLKRASRARKRGKIVICDRYPQTTIAGQNDGPLLSEYERCDNALLRMLARYEKACYTVSDQTAPDLVIKLIGDPDVLSNRRPEMQKERIIKNQAGIKAVQFPDSTRVVEIDADKSVDEVTALIMSAIGNKLLSMYNQNNFD